MTPHLIAIAGPSCSGKSEIARATAKHLPGRAFILLLDSYYRDMSHLSAVERTQGNFDAPEALDSELLTRHVRALAQGRAIERPEYLFDCHVRSGALLHVEPEPFIIIEGLFALYWEALRRLCHTKVFVQVPHPVSLARRLERDCRERGRTPASVQRQFYATVLPMCEKYLLPTSQYADVILDGEQSLDASAALVLRHAAPEIADSTPG